MQLRLDTSLGGLKGKVSLCVNFKSPRGVLSAAFYILLIFFAWDLEWTEYICLGRVGMLYTWFAEVRRDLIGPVWDKPNGLSPELLPLWLARLL